MEPLFCWFCAAVETWLHYICGLSKRQPPHPFVDVSAVSQQTETQDVFVNKEISPVCEPTSMFFFFFDNNYELVLNTAVLSKNKEKKGTKKDAIFLHNM